MYQGSVPGLNAALSASISNTSESELNAVLYGKNWQSLLSSENMSLKLSSQSSFLENLQSYAIKNCDSLIFGSFKCFLAR
jgi:hypothetical protein